MSAALDAPRQSVTTGAAGRIGYYSDLDAPGRPLLLLHSINAAPSAFETRPLFEYFRGKRPVIAPDLPGFGCSERADLDYSAKLYADALVEFTAAAVGRSVDAVAMSTSAEFLARSALTDAAAFTSLVFISPTGLSRRPPPSTRASKRLERFFGLPVLSQGLFRALTSRASIRYFLGLNFAGAPPVEMVDYAYETAHQPNARYAPYSFLAMKLFSRDALETLYKPLSQPTLVLYDRDPNVGFERLPELLEANPNCRASRISPTLGLPHWEALDRTVQAMEEFWSDAND